jgi:hypothetical protein
MIIALERMRPVLEARTAKIAGEQAPSNDASKRVARAMTA